MCRGAQRLFAPTQGQAQPFGLCADLGWRGNGRGCAFQRAIVKRCVPNKGRWTCNLLFGPADTLGHARPSPREGAVAMTFTAPPTCMLQSAALRSNAVSAHPGSGAALRALCRSRMAGKWARARVSERYCQTMGVNKEKMELRSTVWPGGYAGPRPTLPAGGRSGGAGSSSDDVDAFERSAFWTRHMRPPRVRRGPSCVAPL